MKRWPYAELTTIFFLTAVFALFHVDCVGRVRADDGTLMITVRSLIGEAGESGHVDHQAILNVYTYRHALPAWRNRPMRELVARYSAAVRPGLPMNANRLRVLHITEERAPVRVVDLVKRWLAGEDIGNPCNGATQYGSWADASRTRLRRVTCTGRTRNVFLRGAR